MAHVACYLDGALLWPQPQRGNGGDSLTGSLRTASEAAMRSGDGLGDHHGYLLRMRLEGGLEGIELGPQLVRALLA